MGLLCCPIVLPSTTERAESCMWLRCSTSVGSRKRLTTLMSVGPLMLRDGRDERRHGGRKFVRLRQLIRPQPDADGDGDGDNGEERGGEQRSAAVVADGFARTGDMDR